MPESIDLARLLELHHTSRLQDIHTAIPAVVESYDLATKTVVIKPTIQEPGVDPDTGEDTLYSWPSIPDVPVLFPAAGGFSLTFPIAAGDSGLLVFSEAAMATWRATGQESAPVDTRRLTAGYPVFLPGLYPDTKTVSQGTTSSARLGKDGGAFIDVAAAAVHIDAADVRLGGSGAETLVKAPEMDGLLDSLSNLISLLSAALAAVSADAGTAPLGATSVAPTSAFVTAATAFATSVTAAKTAYKTVNTTAK